MTDLKITKIRVTIEHCQRCGEIHKGLEFSTLNNPTDNFSYWAMCPTIQQPILLAILGDEDKTGVKASFDTQKFAEQMEEIDKAFAQVDYACRHISNGVDFKYTLPDHSGKRKVVGRLESKLGG